MDPAIRSGVPTRSGSSPASRSSLGVAAMSHAASFMVDKVVYEAVQAAWMAVNQGWKQAQQRSCPLRPESKHRSPSCT